MPSNSTRAGRFSKGTTRTIGVTGGIGSGKTTACRLLRQQGLPVLSADPLAIEIEETDRVVIKAIKTLLGSEAYLAGGALNRPYVAKSVFSNKRIRRSIEALVHPAVFRELHRRVTDLGKAGNRLVVIEAALIFESGMDTYLDFVVVVDADEPVRIARVKKRDGITAGEVRKRMSVQWPMERKTRLADFVIGNNGSREELRSKVHLLRAIIDQLA